MGWEYIVTPQAKLQQQLEKRTEQLSHMREELHKVQGVSTRYSPSSSIILEA